MFSENGGATSNVHFTHQIATRTSSGRTPMTPIIFNTYWCAGLVGHMPGVVYRGSGRITVVRARLGPVCAVANGSGGPRIAQTLCYVFPASDTVVTEHAKPRAEPYTADIMAHEGLIFALLSGNLLCLTGKAHNGITVVGHCNMSLLQTHRAIVIGFTRNNLTRACYASTGQYSCRLSSYCILRSRGSEQWVKSVAQVVVP